MIKILPFSKHLGSRHDGVRPWNGGHPDFKVVEPGEPFDYVWLHSWGDGDSLVEDMEKAKRIGKCIFLIQGDKCYVPDHDDGNVYFITHLHSNTTAKQYQVPYSYHSSLAWWRENKDKTFEKKYLASFMGSMLTNPARRKLFDIAAPDIPIIERDGWQLSQQDYETHHRGIKEHSDLICASHFTLCPRGIGKTSIRVVEAIIRGSVPVLLDDGTNLFSSLPEIHFSSNGVIVPRKQESTIFVIRYPLSFGMQSLGEVLQDSIKSGVCGKRCLEMNKWRNQFLLRDELSGFPNDIGFTAWIVDKIQESR